MRKLHVVLELFPIKKKNMITFPYESMPNRIDNQLKPPSGDLEMPAVSGGSLDQKKQQIDLGILIGMTWHEHLLQPISSLCGIPTFGPRKH